MLQTVNMNKEQVNIAIFETCLFWLVIDKYVTPDNISLSLNLMILYNITMITVRENESGSKKLSKKEQNRN